MSLSMFKSPMISVTIALISIWCLSVQATKRACPEPWRSQATLVDHPQYDEAVLLCHLLTSVYIDYDNNDSNDEDYAGDPRSPSSGWLRRLSVDRNASHDMPRFIKPDPDALKQFISIDSDADAYNQANIQRQVELQEEILKESERLKDLVYSLKLQRKHQDVEYSGQAEFSADQYTDKSVPDLLIHYAKFPQP